MQPHGQFPHQYPPAQQHAQQMHHGHPHAPAAASAPAAKPSVAHIEQWNPTEDERSAIDAWFIEIDNKFSGSVGGADAVQFFKRSNLPKDTLREVWSLADQHKAGKLDRQQFFFAIRLITVLCNPIYAGSKPSVDLYNTTVNKRLSLPMQLNIKPEVAKEEPKVEVKKEEPPVVPPPSTHQMPTYPPQPHPGHPQQHQPYPTQPLHQYPLHQAPPAYQVPPQNQYPPNYLQQAQQPPPHQYAPAYYTGGMAQPHSPHSPAFHAQPVHSPSRPPVVVAPVEEEEEFSDFAEAPSVSVPVAPPQQQQQLHQQPHSPIPAMSPTPLIVHSQVDLLHIEVIPTATLAQEPPGLKETTTNEDEDFTDFVTAAPSPPAAPHSTTTVPFAAHNVHHVPATVDLSTLADLQQESRHHSYSVHKGEISPVPTQLELALQAEEAKDTKVHGIATSEPVKPVNYDASKLSIFDEMVENDLMAMTEDWDEFAGSTAEAGQPQDQNHHQQPAQHHTQQQEQPVSVNPFDEFVDFLDNPNADSTSIAYPPSDPSQAPTEEYTRPRELSEIPVVQIPPTSRQNSFMLEQEEVAFGDFESHNDIIPPREEEAAPKRPVSIHRSDGIPDLKKFAHEMKHCHVSYEVSATTVSEGHQPQVTSTSSPVSSTLGSEMSGKLTSSSVKSAVFIEESIHRCAEVVDFANLRSPEPILVRHNSSGEPMAVEETEGVGSGKTFVSYQSNINDTLSSAASQKTNLTSEMDLSSASSKNHHTPTSVGNEQQHTYPIETEKTVFRSLNESSLEVHKESTSKTHEDPFAHLEPEPVTAPPEEEEEDEWDEIGEFQECISEPTSAKEEKVPVLGRSMSDAADERDLQALRKAQPESLSMNPPAPIAVTHHPQQDTGDLLDLLDFSPLDQSNVAVVSPRQQQMHQTTAPNDFLSMDFLSQELPPLSHGVVASHPLPTQHHHQDLHFEADFAPQFDDFSPSVSSPPTNDNSNKYNTAEEDFFATKNNEEDEFEEFASFTSAEPVPVPPPPALAQPAQQKVEENVSPIAKPSSTRSTSSVEDNNNKPLTLQTLEILSLQLYEFYFYEAAYNCVQQTLLLRQINDLTEQKKHAMENDELELAIQYKNQQKTIAQTLQNPQIEKQWILLASGDFQVHSIQDYQQRIQKSIQTLSSSSNSPNSSSSFSSFFGGSSSPGKQNNTSAAAAQALFKSMSIRIQQTYFESAVLPEKHSPMELQLKYYVITKRSLKIIDYLLSSPGYYEFYSKVYNELLGVLGNSLNQIQQTLTNYYRLDKNAVQQEVRSHPKMQTFLQETLIVVENTIYLCVAAMETLVYDRSLIGLGDKRFPNGSEVQTNVAMKLFQQAHEILKYSCGQFDLSSPVNQFFVFYSQFDFFISFSYLLVIEEVCR
jgi:hypothetical protein